MRGKPSEFDPKMLYFGVSNRGGGICCNSPPEMRPGEQDAHEGGIGPDAHGAEREEDDAGGLVLGVALERVL